MAACPKLALLYAPLTDALMLVMLQLTSKWPADLHRHVAQHLWSPSATALRRRALALQAGERSAAACSGVSCVRQQLRAQQHLAAMRR